MNANKGEKSEIQKGLNLKNEFRVEMNINLN